MNDQKKIAIIVAANIYEQKGLFLAVHNRCRHLKRIANYEIDVFLLSSYKDYIVSKILREETYKRPKSYIKDEIRYIILWRRNSVIDYILYHKLHQREFFHYIYNKNILHLFQNYDLLDVHSGCGEIALDFKKKFGKPYVITWHGSDIHTEPFQNNTIFSKTKEIIENADCNFFVSSALLYLSDKITTKGAKQVLYNGKAKEFIVYDYSKRESLIKKLNSQKKKIIAFVGNLVPIKNIKDLPGIFHIIYKNIPNAEFWIICDGPLKKKLCEVTILLPSKFWGNIDSKRMPDMMNCIDLVVVPSINEALSLVAIEALGCGCNVVGSNVGGIPEVIGINNVFNLDENFIENISGRAIEMLNKDIKQELDSKFNWNASAIFEKRIIDYILNC